MAGLKVGYGRRQVLTGVNLDVAAGHTLALMGPGGTGKSTLLEVLAGGHCEGLWYEGAVANSGSPVRRMRQTPPPLECNLNSLLTSELGDSATDRLAEIWSCAPDAAEFLISVGDEPFGHLPVGTRRLASLTLALAHRAPVTLLDEPTADQESHLEDWVLAKLKAERRRSTTVLVTHNLLLARQVADEAALLIEGRILETAPITKFFDDPVHERTREFVRLGS